MWSFLNYYAAGIQAATGILTLVVTATSLAMAGIAISVSRRATRASEKSAQASAEQIRVTLEAQDRSTRPLIRIENARQMDGRVLADKLRITNVGLGPAFGVKAEYIPTPEINEPGGTIYLKSDALGVGDALDFPVHKARASILGVRVLYRSTQGTEFKAERLLDPNTYDHTILHS